MLHQVPELVIEIKQIFHEDIDVAVFEGILPYGNDVHHHLNQSNRNRAEDSDKIHPCPDGKPDPCRRPDACSGRKAFDASAVFKDDPRADKADTADHLCRQTGGIRAAGPVERFSRSRGKVCKAIFGNNHDQCRSAADNHMRADTGLLEAPAALHAEDKTAQTGYKNPYGEIKILQQRKLAVQIRGKHGSQLLFYRDFS